jgi:hypothetical protein
LGGTRSGAIGAPWPGATVTIRSIVAKRRPTTGKRLTARMNTSRRKDGEMVSNRQAGYGLVFGIPKSLSVYLAITGDQVVESIARLAVDETMQAHPQQGSVASIGDAAR